MNRAHVFIAGSVRAESMLRAIGAALESRGTATDTHIGRLADARDTPVWRRADVLLAADTTCVRDDIAAAPRLRAIVTPVLGVDGFDVPAATAAGVLVVNGQVCENYESMAESTILLALACLYDLPRQQIGSMGSDASGTTRPQGRMLKKKTVGIIGYGNVARAVIARLHGWAVDIVVYSRHCDPQGDGPADRPRFVTLDELLRRSDVVMVLCSLNEESRHLLDASRLGSLKRGAVLVNTARGGIVDEQALVRLARSGHISHLGLDVFEQEPLPADSDLCRLSNAILTPHAIGHTVEALAAIHEQAIDNVLEILRGHAQMPVRNPQILADWRVKWDGKSLLQV
jgi:phosphoglycerate dehydrogenase-like enzyme